MKYFLAIFRLIIFFGATLSLYAMWFVGDIFIPNKVYWRQVIFGAWSRMFARVAGMKISVVGVPPTPPFLLVSNHLGYVDIPLLRAVCKAVFVAKGEIENWFLAGRLTRDMGNIFVNRQNRRDIPRASKAVTEKIEQGEGVIIFPEGKSTKGEEVGRFNSSFLEFAAVADLPVHYAAITYRTPNNFPPADTICWWMEDQTPVAHLWELFKIPEFEAVIFFGEKPVSDADRKILTKRLWEKVSEKFIPVL